MQYDDLSPILALMMTTSVHFSPHWDIRLESAPLRREWRGRGGEVHIFPRYVPTTAVCLHKRSPVGSKSLQQPTKLADISVYTHVCKIVKKSRSISTRCHLCSHLSVTVTDCPYRRPDQTKILCQGGPDFPPSPCPRSFIHILVPLSGYTGQDRTGQDWVSRAFVSLFLSHIHVCVCVCVYVLLPYNVQL